jgi:hypothetical protein
MTIYYIYGFDPFTEEKVLLFDTDSENRAIEWAKQYAKSEYMGGWKMVYVCYLTQVDVDWDGDPVSEEIIVWSCYNEPMVYNDNALEEF